MIRLALAALLLAGVAAPGPVAARGGTPQDRDCVSAGFFAIEGFQQQFASGRYAYGVQVRNRGGSPRGFRVVFNPPEGATSITAANGHSLQGWGSGTFSLGHSPNVLTNQQLQAATQIRCLA